VKVGLVLGAGGVMGGSWLTGGLQALAQHTGWDPASADYVVGTSAGSMIGALLAGGVPPWFMVAHSAGESFDSITDAQQRPAATADRAGGAVFKLHRGIALPGPGSWRLIANGLRDPRRHRPAALAAGWLPRGVVSTQPLQDTVRRVVPSGWAEHPNLWIVACHYDQGRRVAFGREDAPTCDLAEAVAASCAIPGFYRPVKIAGRHYVDGGVWSGSNLDILRNAGLDLVICLNPTSSLDVTPSRGPGGAISARLRGQSGRRLGWEARRLREAGTQVVLIQPTARDVEAMGPNLMSRRNRNTVIETAIDTVGDQLRDIAEPGGLDQLPPGEPHRIARPAGPPSQWRVDLLPGRAGRAAAAAEPSTRA
jgi:NTE family protein